MLNAYAIFTLTIIICKTFAFFQVRKLNRRVLYRRISDLQQIKFNEMFTSKIAHILRTNIFYFNLYHVGYTILIHFIIQFSIKALEIMHFLHLSLSLMEWTTCICCCIQFKIQKTTTWKQFFRTNIFVDGALRNKFVMAN